MRKTRLFTAALALCPVLGLAIAAAPAATAATTVAATASAAAAPAVRGMVNPDIVFSCPPSYYDLSGPYTKVVNSAHIHIWDNDPNHGGKVSFSIAQGAHFRSSWKPAEGGTVACKSPLESGPEPTQHWILGWDTADPSHEGWVGLKYLNS